MNGTPRIVIGICSCHLNSALQCAVRQTWLRRLPENMKPLFFVGVGKSATQPDVVQLPVDDAYEALPAKVHAFFQHTLQSHAFEYLFKCDDDTYLVPQRLMSLVGKGEYIGSTHLARDNIA